MRDNWRIHDGIGGVRFARFATGTTLWMYVKLLNIKNKPDTTWNPLGATQLHSIQHRAQSNIFRKS